MAKIERRAVVSSSSSSSSSSSASSYSAANTNAAAATGTYASGNSITKTKTKSNDKSQTGKNVEYNNIPTAMPYADPLRNNDISAAAQQQQQQQQTTHIGAAKPTQSSATGQSPYTAQPTFINSASLPPHFSRNVTSSDLLDAERTRIRNEFYATYDVMTGVRIAATLGGFFGLMVFLIVWKSRSSSNETMKVLKDPKMAAVAAVCMQEEEEREIQEAMVATGMSIYPDEYDAILYRRQRMLSLGNVSAPPMLNRGYRFSSVGGGYSSLLEPPRRFSYSATSGDGASLASARRKSGSQSSRIFSNYAMGSSFGTDDYFIESEDEMENGDYQKRIKCLEEEEVIHHQRSDSTKSKHGFLEVPLTGHDSRRSSAMTCCSTDSSYLERRTSAFTLGVPNLPPALQRKSSTASHASSICNWDYYYPDIQVIEPTPRASPCPSERSSYEQLQKQDALKVTTIAETVSAPTIKAATHTTATNASITTKTGKTHFASNIGETLPANNFKRKHSIAYYDPDSAQAGRKQQIHSISADTVDVYPYNQTDAMLATPIQSAPPASIHKGFTFTDSPTEELRLSVLRKIAVVELPKALKSSDDTLSPPICSSGVCENNNNFPYTNAAANFTNATVNSSSQSIDSTPVSIDKLNGSGSIGTVSGKALFNAAKRAPLASLSSFKISSLEYQDSEMRSLDEDSVFVDSVADTDEDIQQYSSDSEEASIDDDVDVDVGHATLRRENTVLTRPAANIETVQSKEIIHKPIAKHFSVATPQDTSTNFVTRARHPLLQHRHRTISASSSDRISLIGQQMQEFSSVNQSPARSPPINANAPLETHFGVVISTNSPPMHPRPAKLLQQYSDPHSFGTPTTTTTGTTEEDTCSTLNTELGAIAVVDATGSGSVTTGSTSHTQHSSLTTVVSTERISPLVEDPNYSSSFVKAAEIDNKNLSNSEAATRSPALQLQQPQQLPRSRLANDPCASSISDSFINSRQQTIISMPASLKNLILRGADRGVAATPTQHSKSATNLCFLETHRGADDDDDDDDNVVLTDSRHSAVGVMLELPLIKLPTDESSESSSVSADFQHTSSRSKSDESRDPSLPGSSRKWSKETLF